MPTGQQQVIAHSAAPRLFGPPRENSVVYITVYGDDDYNDDNNNNNNNNVM